MTHCNVIAALSDQLRIKVSLERRYICFINKYLSSSNSIVNVISHIAICNPMSTARKYYRLVLDANNDYNTNHMATSWQDTCESIEESINPRKPYATPVTRNLNRPCCLAHSPI